MEEKYPKLNLAQPQNCIASKTMRCNRIISQIFRKHLLEFGLTNSQMTIMFVIAKKKDVTQAYYPKFYFLKNLLSVGI